jgi:tetratricopeptide (TPR) repeat protein
MLRSPATALLLAALLPGAGCGGSARGGPETGPDSDGEPDGVLDPIHVTAERDGERIVLDAYDATGLFERAAVHLRAGACDQAAQVYAKLVAEFPESDLVEPSLYNRGLCLDQLQRYQEAAACYTTLVERFPESHDVSDALFRLAGSYERLEAFEDAVAVFDRLLGERKDLRGVERVEALARKGSAQIRLQQPDAARLTLEEAVRTYRMGQGISPSDSVFHYSMAQFKLGEIVHGEMREVELPPDEELLAEALENKAQRLLDAQRLYTKVIRIGHAHWAAAAAYRIGALYHHLWVDILDAPPPEELGREEQQIYFEILRERIRVLLKKAVVQWERTLKLAIRLGLDNEWIEKTTRDLEAIRKILVLEAAGEDPREPPEDE